MPATQVGPSRLNNSSCSPRDCVANQLYCLVLGEYRVGLKFNDQHVPDSPFKVYISPAAGDAHLLEVAQFPEGAVQADKPAQFIVRKNGAKGDLDAKVRFPALFMFTSLLTVFI